MEILRVNKKFKVLELPMFFGYSLSMSCYWELKRCLETYGEITEIISDKPLLNNQTLTIPKKQNVKIDVTFFITENDHSEDDRLLLVTELNNWYAMLLNSTIFIKDIRPDLYKAQIRVDNINYWIHPVSLVQDRKGVLDEITFSIEEILT